MATLVSMLTDLFLLLRDLDSEDPQKADAFLAQISATNNLGKKAADAWKELYRNNQKLLDTFGS